MARKLVFTAAPEVKLSRTIVIQRDSVGVTGEAEYKRQGKRLARILHRALPWRTLYALMAELDTLTTGADA